MTYISTRTNHTQQGTVELADGSRIWLNKASSIHYTIDGSKVRQGVDISGEVFFDVSRNEDKPFVVMAGDLQIETLGARFNVNAYKGNPTETITLLDGHLKILRGKSFVILSRGQQVQFRPDAPILLLYRQDISQSVAWKRG
jgi:transmembrane sensor